MDHHAAKRHSDRDVGAAPLTTRPTDSEDAEAQEVVLRLDGGTEVSVPITKASMEQFRALRHAQRLRVGRFWKQLGEDVQLGKEPPENHEFYDYISPVAVHGLREIWAIVTGSSKKISKSGEATGERKERPRGPRVPLDAIIAAAIEAQRKNLAVANWPENVLYTPKLLHEEDLRTWHAGGSTLELDKPATLAAYVEVQKIKDPLHPAYPGYGIFATRDIAPEVEIGQYAGLLRRKSKNNDSESLYIAALTPETDVDAERTGNEIRFINDYRNTGQTPNVEYKRYRLSHRVILAVKTTRDVKKGEELLIDYGEQYWKMIKRRCRAAGTLLPDEDSDEIASDSLAADDDSDEDAAADAVTVAWTRTLEEEVFQHPATNPALDWFVREELPMLLSSRRRSFTVPKRHRGEQHDTDVFARLGWASSASSFHEFKVPHSFDLMHFGTTYTALVAQKAAGRKRPVPQPASNHSHSNGAAPKRRKNDSAEENQLPLAYPELEALVHLQQLQKDEVLSGAQYVRFKTSLLRNLERRFG